MQAEGFYRLLSQAPGSLYLDNFSVGDMPPLWASAVSHVPKPSNQLNRVYKTSVKNGKKNDPMLEKMHQF